MYRKQEVKTDESGESSEPKQRFQVYKLFCQNDYNSKGHQQWFNFTITNIDRETNYHFQIGPFKKPSSKF